MARAVFSVRFIAQAGLNGSTSSVTVPPGHTYIVKQVGAYGNSSVTAIDCFLTDDASGAALWHGKIDGATNGWDGWFGSFTFEEGESFHMNVNAAPIDTADVYAGGYDLTN